MLLPADHQSRDFFLFLGSCSEAAALTAAFSPTFDIVHLYEGTWALLSHSRMLRVQQEVLFAIISFVFTRLDSWEELLIVLARIARLVQWERLLLAGLDEFHGASPDIYRFIYAI